MRAHRFAIAIVVALATVASQAVVATAACASDCEMIKEASDSCCPLAARRPPSNSLRRARPDCCDPGVWYAFDDATVQEPMRDPENRRLVAVAPRERVRVVERAIAMAVQAYPRPPPPPGRRANATIVLLL